MITSLKIENRNSFEEEDKVASLVSAAGIYYPSTIIGKTKRPESDEDAEITFDALIERNCKLWRLSGEGKGDVEEENKPLETCLENPVGFCWKCHSCGERGHKSIDYPNTYKRTGGAPKDEYLGYGQPICHATENCWEDPKNASRRCDNWVSHIKNTKKHRG